MRSYSRSALLALFFTLFIGGMATGRWELVAAMVPLVVVIFLEVQYGLPTRLDLSADLQMGPEEVMEGEDIDLKIQLRNRGPDLRGGMVHLDFPQGLRVVQGHRCLPVSIKARGEVELAWRLKVEVRGRYSLGPLNVTVRDFFRLYERSTSVPLKGTVRATPRIEQLSKVGLRPSLLRPHTGSLRTSLTGMGTDFYCLREYRSGDQFRHINWKASAKKEVMVTNAMEDERSGDLILLLDLQMSEGELRERSIQAAASLGSFWLRERNRVGMIVLGEHVDHVPMGLGRRHLYRLNEKLMETGAGNPRAPLSAEKAWLRHFPCQALVVVITPLLETATASAVKRLVRRGAEVLLICPYGTVGQEDKAGEIAARLQAMRRDDLLYDLNDFCRVVKWDIQAPLARCLLRVMRW